MESIHQLTAKVRSISVPVGLCTLNKMQKRPRRKNNSFMLVDSAEMELSSFTSTARTDDAVMLYVDKGEVIIMHDMKIYTLSEGMLFLKVPKVTVQLLSSSENCHFTVFDFAPEFAIAPGMPIKHLETIALVASKNPVLMLDTLNAASVGALFSLLEKKGSLDEKTDLYDETVQHVFSLLILEIVCVIKRMITETPSQHNRKVYLTFQFLKLLREHIKEHRSVNSYADMLYVTPKHLSRLVKEITGKTCGEIIDEMVVAEAKLLLHNSELTIAHVANELNFSDQFFFSKYFKKQTGMSPLNYRMAV